MKDREYGYFGKGLSGYAHYRTALKRTQRKGQTPAAHDPQPPHAAPGPDPKQQEQDGPSEGVYIFLIVCGLVLACVVLVAIQQMLMNL